MIEPPSAVALIRKRIGSYLPFVCQVEEDLCELPVAALVRRPPVPVVKPLAVALFLAPPPRPVGGGGRLEHEPLAELARPARVGLETFSLAGQGVLLSPTVSSHIL